ncbi:hypothetical protein, partial [Caballeronia glebae]|uniref:hypothetical protein n=1 Tax=Caballeronia glebae TaxID=1777143 RepID=UPI001F32A258
PRSLHENRLLHHMLATPAKVILLTPLSRDPQIRPQLSRLFASRPSDADISGPDKNTNARSYS